MKRRSSVLGLHWRLPSLLVLLVLAWLGWLLQAALLGVIRLAVATLRRVTQVPRVRAPLGPRRSGRSPATAL